MNNEYLLESDEKEIKEAQKTTEEQLRANIDELNKRIARYEKQEKFRDKVLSIKTKAKNKFDEFVNKHIFD